MAGEEKLHDREGVRSEDQQALYERNQVAQEGSGARSDTVHLERGDDVVDDPAERSQEVQTPEEGKADKPKSKKAKGKRGGQRRVGQITKRGSDKYLIRVFKGLDKATGKRLYHTETVYGKKSQADDRIREILTRLKTGEPLKVSKDSFESFIEEWLESKRHSVSEVSFKCYEKAIKYYIRPQLGSKLLAQIDSDHIQKAYNKLKQEDLSRTTIRYVHKLLGMIFKLAVIRKKIQGSPMVGVELPKDWEEGEEAKTKAMTVDQVGTFLAAAKGTRFENLFRLAFHIGCRPGELLALKWEDVNPSARTLRINQSIVWRKGGDWYLKRPKTKQSRRTIAITEALLEVLAAQHSLQREAKLKAKQWKDHGFIFTDENGGPHSQQQLWSDCRRILKNGGLPWSFNPYTARHTMATLLIEGGTNVKAVSERLGHSRVGITLDTYTHVSEGMQRGVSEDIERILSGDK